MVTFFLFPFSTLELDADGLMERKTLQYIKLNT